MALPSSHTALPSLDVGHLSRPHPQQRITFLPIQIQHGHGFLAMRSFPRRPLHISAEASSSSLASVAVADTPKLDGDKCQELRMQIIEENIAKRPFKIQELDAGGEKDWHSSEVSAVQDLAPGIRRIIVQTECSREMVCLENAYTKPGQQAQVKVNGEENVKVTVASPPFSSQMNETVLYKARGDIPAGTTKQALYFLSVTAPLELLVSQADNPAVFNLKEGDKVEIGPFDESGLDLRPILFLTRFPTILLFASGKGIAVAKAIIEAKDADMGSLNLGLREQTRLFYWSPEPSLVLYKDLFKKWESRKLKVRTAVGKISGKDWNSHEGSFQSLWDEDDLEYDPETTAVVVCVDQENRDEVENLLADAGISEKQILRWET